MSSKLRSYSVDIYRRKTETVHVNVTATSKERAEEKIRDGSIVLPHWPDGSDININAVDVQIRVYSKES